MTGMDKRKKTEGIDGQERVNKEEEGEKEDEEMLCD